MIKKKPIISVVMSVYNGEKTVSEAIESILGQSFGDFELLIVDDGSDDRTSEVISGFSDKRITVINHKKSIGLTKSLIEAVGLAKGEFVARMDADDLSHPKRFESEIKYLTGNKNLGLVGTWFEVINENGSVLAKHKPANGRKITSENLVGSNQFAHGSVMFRKSIYQNAGGYRSFFRYAQDYDLWLRISQISEIAVLSKYLYKWRVHDHAISVDKRALQNKYAQIARMSYRERVLGKKETISQKDRQSKKSIETFLEVSSKDKALGYLNWAWTLFFYNEYSASYKKAFTSLKLWPLNIEAYFLLILSIVFKMLPKKISTMIKNINKNF